MRKSLPKKIGEYATFGRIFNAIFGVNPFGGEAAVWAGDSKDIYTYVFFNQHPKVRPRPKTRAG